jgi:hypothetical protein
MAEPAEPETTEDGGLDIISQSFYDLEGNPVDDPKKAVGGDVYIRYPSGEIVHHAVVNTENIPKDGRVVPPQTTGGHKPAIKRRVKRR